MNGEAAPRWRSRAVNLVLLGTAGSLATLLGGCSGSTTYSNDYHRNVYASAADCARDYSPSQCTSGSTGGVSRVLGPTYRVVGGLPSACATGDPGPGRLSGGLASPRTGIERGGFGPSCGRRRYTSSGRGTRFFGG